jgi:hypothetical protein
MGMPVVTVASGGLPVVDNTAAALKSGTAVTEATNKFGVAVTKVAAGGMPVMYETIGIAPPVIFSTWDTATAANVTLSGGNLVVTNTNTLNEAGAHVASTSGKTSGKYYFEVTSTNAASGGNMSTGIGTPSSTFTSMGNGGAVVGDVVYAASGGGSIYANGSFITTLGTFANGDVAGMAVDLDNRKIWFRKAPAGNWNNSGTADPATNVGGITIPAGTMVPFAIFGAAAAGNIWTANFGASAFTGVVPVGFTSGWPV